MASPPDPVTLDSADVSEMSKVEKLKSSSQGLFWVAGRERHSFASEIDALSGGDAETLSNEAKELSKHFGIYKQQLRIEGRKSGGYIFMVRLRVPSGGEFSPDQWMAVDDAAERFADGTIRITTRQGIQFHHVTGKNLGALIRHLGQEYAHRGYEMTTLGACGDVNRNTMASPIDDLDSELPLRSRELAFDIANALAPRAGGSSYFQIFMETDAGKRLEPVLVDEPVYGEHYLPRKFKVGIAHPHDNSVDVMSQDVGLVPIVSDGEANEFDLYSGGGLGITHNNPMTRQHVGLYLGRIPREQVVETVRAIAILQKENGERKDRRQARWKYTIRRLGVERVKTRLRERFSIRLEDAEPTTLPDNRFSLGWHRQAAQDGGADDLWYLGVPVLSGRLADRNGARTRTAVRELVRELDLGVRLTGNQDLLLCGVPDAARERVDAVLAEHGAASVSEVSRVRRQALACPAKPTCGLAMTDAENILPVYLEAIEAAGLGDVDVVIRIAGCPNGCSRPATAEIGIIGYGKNDHMIQVGSSRSGARIARVLYERVPEEDMTRVLVGIVRAIRELGSPDQPAGEFLNEVPVEQLREFVGFADG